MKKLLSILLIVGFSVPLLAQQFDRAKLDSLFSRIEKHEKGLGSISIFQDGKEVYQRAFGFADVAQKIPATSQTKYRIGSISKTFTAAIMLQMVDEKKLSLDTKLARFFPEMPNAASITIEQLLRHRSGLYNFTNAADYSSWMVAPKTREELLKLFVKNGTVFEPGAKAEYSNTNYVLLSLIAEKIDKKEFDKILQSRITRPLKLNSTYYGARLNPAKQEARSYTRLESWTEAPETDMSIPMGAGALVSTPADLNTFFWALMNGKVVSQNSLNEMQKLQDNFGMGLFPIPFYDKTAMGHNGGIDGFQSNAAYFPQDKVGIAYLSNGVSMPMNTILIGVLSIYFGKDYTLPDFKPGLQLSSQELDQYQGTYSSPGFPLKLAISKKDNVLIGQATGQSSFPLEAYEPHKFKFDPAGITLEFMPAEQKLVLRQGGNVIEMKKEE